MMHSYYGQASLSNRRAFDVASEVDMDYSPDGGDDANHGDIKREQAASEVKNGDKGEKRGTINRVNRTSF